MSYSLPFNPNDRNDFSLFGKIVKVFGNKGEMIARIFIDDPERITTKESIFVEFDCGLIPFFLEDIDLGPGGNGHFKLIDIDTPEEATTFAGKDIYIPTVYLPGFAGEGSLSYDILGFKVIDKRLGEIGKIHSIINNTQQSILQIIHGGKEILIPLVAEIIEKVDRRKKCVYINAPEGLVELYS